MSECRGRRRRRSGQPQRPGQHETPRPGQDHRPHLQPRPQRQPDRAAPGPPWPSRHWGLLPGTDPRHQRHPKNPDLGRGKPPPDPRRPGPHPAIQVRCRRAKNPQARPPGRDRLRQPVLHPKTRRHRHQARLRRHHQDRQQAPAPGRPQRQPAGQNPPTRRTSTSTTPTTSAAAATSPTSTASSTSTSSTSRSARAGWSRTPTSSARRTCSPQKNWTRRRSCITSGRGITIRGPPCGRVGIRYLAPIWMGNRTVVSTGRITSGFTATAV